MMKVSLKHSHTILRLELLKKLIRYTTYMKYCVVSAKFKTQFHAYIVFQNLFITYRLGCYIVSHRIFGEKGGGVIEIGFIHREVAGIDIKNSIFIKF